MYLDSLFAMYIQNWNELDESDYPIMQRTKGDSSVQSATCLRQCDSLAVKLLLKVLGAIQQPMSCLTHSIGVLSSFFFSGR